MPQEIWAFTLNGFNAPRWFRGMLDALWTSGALPGPDALKPIWSIVAPIMRRSWDANTPRLKELIEADSR